MEVDLVLEGQGLVDQLEGVLHVFLFQEDVNALNFKFKVQVLRQLISKVNNLNQQRNQLLVLDQLLLHSHESPSLVSLVHPAVHAAMHQCNVHSLVPHLNAAILEKHHFLVVPLLQCLPKGKVSLDVLCMLLRSIQEREAVRKAQVLCWFRQSSGRLHRGIQALPLQGLLMLLVLLFQDVPRFVVKVVYRL